MLAYVLFVEKGITPGQFYQMPTGEKILLTAFIRHNFRMADDEITEKRIIRGGEEE